jgi:hypothetical protein
MMGTDDSRGVNSATGAILIGGALKLPLRFREER